MILAIHDGEGWNALWAEHAMNLNLNFIVLNFYSTDIVTQLKDNRVTHLMWHFSHNNPADILTARNILFSMEKIGVKVFPDVNSSWHFDDKVSQKYLLEAIEAPMVKSYVFYQHKSAIEWAESVSYPKVAKLRRGAGSYNVRLIKSKEDAIKYINIMFGRGFEPSPGYLSDLTTKIKVAGGIKGVIRRAKKIPRYFQMVYRGKAGFPREKGYAYFQDFIPNNKCDYRVIVVNSKVYGMKRIVRDGDFRASGAGVFDYSEIEKDIIDIARETAIKLGMLSVAFDFVLKEGQPLIVEISYGFGTEGSSKVEHYWNDLDEKVKGRVDAAYEIIKGFINEKK